MSIGKILRWQDDKGFGFVKSDDLDKDIFVHISAFPANSPRPKVGDEVVFQVKNTPKGLQVSQIRYQNNETKTVATSQNSGDYANLKLELERDEQPITQGRNITNRNNATQNKKYNNRSCDGRTTCGQMNSREEAEWFSKNCPNTTMDGDNDGNVCESDSRW